jgi:N6-adenosine-specific RNA methylase IME4
MDALARLSAATAALAEAKTLDDVKQIMDIAEAARTYARAAKLGLEAANHAAEVKLRAERKAGELLQQLERAPEGRPQKLDQPGIVSEYRAVLTDSDIAPTTAHRWQTVATVPDDIFEEHVATVQQEQRELTSAGVLRLAEGIKRQERVASMADAPQMPPGKYRVWYADPPWQYGNAGVIGETDNYGHAARHYPTMSIDELCAMGTDIKANCEDDAVLFLWVTSPLLEECFPVIKAWGFKYKTSFVWDKVGHNFGHYNSVRHELLLVCTRGSCTPDDKTLYDSVVSIEKSRKHSEKPEEFRRIIDSLYTWGSRIELFARTDAEGWAAWGNESNAS